MVRKFSALEIRLMRPEDAEAISRAFDQIGWSKPVEQFLRYLTQQEEGSRVCWVATVEGEFAGYVTLKWDPDSPGLAGTGIPEILDLNVLPKFRRRGIASRLLNCAEEKAAERSKVVGIGVGLHPGYSAALRLYVMRGYVPDGLGVTYRDRYVREGEVLPFDDNLTLHFRRDLS
jgi:GNAT superfamily N-acetyltransferase